MTFAVMGILFGIVFGTRFRVYVLFPAMALACAVIAGVSVHDAADDGPWTEVIAMIVSATGLQIGYFAGILMRGLRTGHAFGLKGDAVSDLAQ
jgi:hypothetical protein